MQENTILTGTHGSDCSQRATEFAARLASRTGNRLLLCYVIQWSPFSFNTVQENEQRHCRREEEIKTAQEKIIAPLLATYRSMNISVEGIVRHGHVAETLLEIASEQDAGHIVVGRRGRTKRKTLLFGSVASHLVQASSVPVTVVP